MSIAAQDCTCIVLASGLSKRFGVENKLLADLGGKPVIAYALDVAAHAGFKEVFVVSPNVPELTNIIKSYGFTWVENKASEAGQGASLALGAETVLANGYKTACIMLADMPFIKYNNIKSLLGKCNLKNSMFSQHNNVVMPPAVFNHTALKDVVDLQGDAGGKNKVKGDLATALPLSDLAARDMDTPEDLEQMRELLHLL